MNIIPRAITHMPMDTNNAKISIIYGSDVCKCILGLSRGKVLHICRCRCTAIHNTHLWVLFSSGVSQNKEGYNATVFNKYNSLLLLYISIITIP